MRSNHGRAEVMSNDPNPRPKLKCALGDFGFVPTGFTGKWSLVYTTELRCLRTSEIQTTRSLDPKHGSVLRQSGS